MSDGPATHRQIRFGRILLVAALLAASAGARLLYAYSVPIALLITFSIFVMAGALAGHPFLGFGVGITLITGFLIGGIGMGQGDRIGGYLCIGVAVLVSLLICISPIATRKLKQWLRPESLSLPENLKLD